MRSLRSFSEKLTILALACSFFAAAQQNTRNPQAQTAPDVSKAEAADKVKVPGAGLPADVDPKAYKLGPDDVIEIRVWREPDLSGLVSVRPDGKITMPMIGEVEAKDLTPQQLGEAITKRLNEYINRPDVTVYVRAVRSKRYYITGEVNRVGSFPLSTPTTVLQALTQAGGFRDFANKKKIIVIRGDKRLKFNYNDVIKGKNLDQNIYLENGDYIVVP